MAGNSQKFIARNRAPRVQIEYDVELYGAEKKVQLPFVMGVLSDLAGKSAVPQPPVQDRAFLEIDVDNFDARMKAMQPRAAFSVPNTLTGEGNLPVDLTFEQISDFEPAAIARKVEPLRRLLQARTELADLMTYMDGKAGAESLIETVLQNPDLLRSLSAATLPDTVTAATEDVPADVALDALRAAAPAEAATEETSGATLGALRAAAPPEPTPEVTAEISSDATLDALRGAAPTDAPEAEDGLAALDTLRNAAIEEAPAADDPSATLDALGARAPEATSVVDAGAAALDALRSAAPTGTPEAEDGMAALDALREVATAEAPAADDPSATLDALAARAPEEAPAGDAGAVALDALRSAAPTGTTDAEGGMAALDALRDAATAETPAPDDPSATLDALAARVPGETPAGDAGAAALDALRSAAPTGAPDAEDGMAALGTLRDAATAEAPAVDDPSATLDALATRAPVEAPAGDAGAAALDALREVAEEKAPKEPPKDTGGTAVLDALRESAVEDVPVSDDQAAALGTLAGQQAGETPAEDGAEAVGSAFAAHRPSQTPVDDTTIAASQDLADLSPPDAPAEEHSTDALEPLAERAAAELLPVPTGTQSSGGGALNSGDLGLDDLDLDDLGLNDLAVDAPAFGTPGPEDTASCPAIAGDPSPETPVAETRAPETRAPETPAVDDLDLDDLGLDDLGLDDLGLDALGLDMPGDETPGGDTAGAENGAERLQEPATESPENDGTGADSLATDLTSAMDTAAAAGHAVSAATSPEAPPKTSRETSAEMPAAGAGAETVAPTDAGRHNISPDDTALDDPGLDEPGLDDPGLENLGLDDLGLDDLGLDDLGLDDLGLDAQKPDNLLPDNLAPDDAGPDISGLEAPDAATPGEAETNATAPIASTPDANTPATAAGVTGSVAAEPKHPYGTLSTPRPERAQLRRKRFRIALFGDFSGRAARGLCETGTALAACKAIPLDVDTVEDVIEGFATSLVLPLGRDGTGIEVRLNGIDDLHPDELYDNVALFAALNGLKQQLGSGATADSALRDLKAWGAEFSTPITPPKRSSAATAVPADRRLSAFQQLIGDTSASLSQPSKVEDLLARIIGPYVVAAEDPEVTGMKAAVDAALSSAMRLVLHHPEFQALESQWRALDFLARRIETDDDLELVLYDISAEELAADLAGAGAEDLADCGLLQLLTGDPLEEENGRGGYSALIGMYTFEETPPHAELLGRIARLAAHVDAPFFAAIAPGFIDTKKPDRHPLVARAWETLRAMPEAGYLGLATPRFLLRHPYGARSDPIYAFPFEEFTMQAGLSGMLWANPVLLIATLLAKSWTEGGAQMSLGGAMSLGDIPFHYVDDAYGDQIALPCTERNLTTSTMEVVITRGLMPVLSLKGQDTVRLGSFQSLAGQEILGRWAGETPAPPSAPDLPQATLSMEIEVPEQTEAEPTTDSDLDDLLAGFDDATTTPADPDAVDEDLAALLEGL